MICTFHHISYYWGNQIKNYVMDGIQNTHEKSDEGMHHRMKSKWKDDIR
jgi:hypothetical protein